MAKMESINVDITPKTTAVARPGDTILIGFDRTLSDEELHDLSEVFQDLTEETGVHIAFVEHATSMVVVRGSEEDEAGLEKEFPPSVTLEGYEERGER